MSCQSAAPFFVKRFYGIHPFFLQVLLGFGSLICILPGDSEHKGSIVTGCCDHGIRDVFDSRRHFPLESMCEIEAVE